MKNPNKVITAGPDNICVTYTDSHKHHWISYDAKQRIEELQLYGNTYKGKSYQDTGTLHLNSKQVKLYRVSVYGVEALTEEEIKDLNFSQSLKITRMQNRCQRLINQWKQQITSKMVNEFLQKMFPKSKFIQAITSDSDYTSDKDINPLTFRELGITQEMLVNKLIEWKILPQNFYQIS